MSPVTFQIEDCEFDFGDFCLGGDWLVEITTNDGGYIFSVIDVISCRRSQAGLVVKLVEEWVSGDLAKPKGQSRVRRAYGEKLLELTSAEARSDNRGCFLHHQREAA